jgi:hypothetical protein
MIQIFGNVGRYKFQRVAASIYSEVVFTENEKWRKKIFHRYQGKPTNLMLHRSLESF